MTTITIDERTKEGKSFLEFVKNLPFVKINEDSNIDKKISKKKRYNAETEKAINDVREGKTFKVENSTQLFKELGI